MSFDPTSILFPMEEHNFLPDDEVKVRSLAAAILSNACQWRRRKQKVEQQQKSRTRRNVEKFHQLIFCRFMSKKESLVRGSKAPSKIAVLDERR
jgi:hypothetical protein